MRTQFLAILGWLILAAPAIASDAPPSDQSIREFLELTNAHQLIDTVKAQVDTIMAGAMHQATQGKPVTPEKQAILDKMQAKMTTVLNDMLNWDSLQAMYLRIYKASFTQSELDGIIKFYKTRAGQAMVKKMPVVMQHVMTETMDLMKPMQEKIAQIQRETIQELKDPPH